MHKVLLSAHHARHTQGPEIPWGDGTAEEGPKMIEEMEELPEDSLKCGKMKAKWAYDNVDWVKTDLFVKFWEY